jgi:hypothetical protein
MRTAPTGLLSSADPEAVFRFAAEAAALTNGHPSGYLSAGMVAALRLNSALLARLRFAAAFSFSTILFSEPRNQFAIFTSGKLGTVPLRGIWTSC